MVIKALTVKQPFTTYIVNGVKTEEYRHRATLYRGPLLICSSKIPFDDDLDPKVFPNGMALGMVDLVDCRPIIRRSKYGFRYAWILAQAQEIEPFPISGRPGIFEVKLEQIPEHLRDSIQARLAAFHRADALLGD
ncbi:MAG: ASCH domain-containing protein [Deltaproteobacteria bacterium]|nr:ASCH domain-containing protein [Deltaproteobacteria bacterium]